MLLDTCALLWLAEGGPQLSPVARNRIAEATAVHISAITGFEIAVKCHADKLRLPALPAEWLQTVLNHHGVSVVALDLGICVAATELPAIHRDPCDRFIIATARARGWPVVTADARFKEYGVEVVW